MSSWVAPAVAAEIWGMNLEQIMQYVSDGTLPSKMDGEFLFVNIDAFRTPTTVVTPQELAALTDGNKDEPQRPNISDWRMVRMRTSRLRRSPAAVISLRNS